MGWASLRGSPGGITAGWVTLEVSLLHTLWQLFDISHHHEIMIYIYIYHINDISMICIYIYISMEKLIEVIRLASNGDRLGTDPGVGCCRILRTCHWFMAPMGRNSRSSVLQNFFGDGMKPWNMVSCWFVNVLSVESCWIQIPSPLIHQPFI